ncbi:MAG: DUF4845 domain-containing protein [Pseudohongiellaceae bacterium]
MNHLTGLPCQRGNMLTGWVPGVVLMACIMLGVVKLVPVYVDHNFLVSATRSVLDSRNAGSLSQTELRGEIARSLRLNNIRDVDSSAVVLVRSGSSPAARIRYERRVPFMYNIDFAIQFDESVD